MSSRELRVRIEASVQGFMAGIAKAQAGISQFDDALQRNAAQRQAIDDLGSSFGKMGLIAAGGVVLATKAAMDWESAWAGVTKTVDGSASQLATLEQQLRKPDWSQWVGELQTGVAAAVVPGFPHCHAPTTTRIGYTALAGN